MNKQNYESNRKKSERRQTVAASIQVVQAQNILCTIGSVAVIPDYFSVGLYTT